MRMGGIWDNYSDLLRTKKSPLTYGLKYIQGLARIYQLNIVVVFTNQWWLRVTRRYGAFYK